jgi:hypothetical protein
MVLGMGLRNGILAITNPISRPMADIKARKGEVRYKIIMGNWTYSLECYALFKTPIDWVG